MGIRQFLDKIEHNFEKGASTRTGMRSTKPSIPSSIVRAA